MESSIKYNLTTEDGIPVTVELFVTQLSGREKPFGIGAKIYQRCTCEEAYVQERFFTRDEALAMLDMLGRCQITPCTLSDVLY